MKNKKESEVLSFVNNFNKFLPVNPIAKYFVIVLIFLQIINILLIFNTVKKIEEKHNGLYAEVDHIIPLPVGYYVNLFDLGCANFMGQETDCPDLAVVESNNDALFLGAIGIYKRVDINIGFSNTFEVTE